MKEKKTMDRYSKRFLRIYKIITARSMEFKDLSDDELHEKIRHLEKQHNQIVGPVISLLKGINILQTTLDMFPYKFLDDEGLYDFHEYRWSRDDIDSCILIAEKSLYYIIKHFPDVNFEYCDDRENPLSVKFTLEDETYGFIEFNSGMINVAVECFNGNYSESSFEIDEDWDGLETIYFAYAFLHRCIHRAIQGRECWFNR